MNNARGFITFTSFTFIFLFTYTALVKLMEFKKFRLILSRHPLIGNMADIVAPALPVIELAVVVLLIHPLYRRTGLKFCCAIMAAFSLYIGYMISTAEHLPCSCGGVLNNLGWTEHLVFNIALTVLAGLTLVLQKRDQKILLQ